MQILTTLITLATWISCNAKELSEIEALAAKPSRCSYERAFEMYGAHCAGLKLTSVPKLKYGIEILDLTDNKLREIKANTFASYTNIKFLYLADNSIYIIEEDAFRPLTSLQTLDLTMNVMKTLPSVIFDLPGLRSLYVSGNPLDSLDVTTKVLTKPIRAPLEQLDMSNCRLNKVPDLGLMPYLKTYNLSLNPLLELDAVHFALACNVFKVDITGSIDNIKHCALRPAITWFQEKSVYFELGDYSKLNSEEFMRCPIEPVSGALNSTYEVCKSQHAQGQSSRRSSRKWELIWGGLLGFMVLFILLLYAIHRVNVARIKKQNLTKSKVLVGDKRAEVALITASKIETGL